MDDLVITAFSVDEMVGIVPGLFEKVSDKIFMMLFGFGLIDVIQEMDEVGFEAVHL